MKKYLFSICAVMALAGSVSVRATTEYKYQFVPSLTQNPNQDPFPNSSWGGTLFLDAPMSAGGSLSDIDLSASVLKTPFGSFNLGQSSDVSIGTVTVDHVKEPVPFTWTASTIILPGTITSMDITGLGPLNVEGSQDAWEITQTSIEISLPDPMVNGVWVASVPDSASTAVLIGLAAAGLFGFGHFSRTRQWAMARS